ncbi:MAG: hypothetical protein HFJ38_00700 [Bacilli bacterium]|nr:hypothetical protein [Bacilli bacterium]
MKLWWRKIIIRIGLYDDFVYSIDVTYSWITHGGYWIYGTFTGEFSFGRATGLVSRDDGSRL